MLFKKRSAEFYLLIILLLSAVVTLLNLGWQKAFVGGDYGVSFHFPDRLINFSYYIWDRFRAPGNQTTINTMAFLWTNFIFILFKLGLKPLLIERLAYFLFFIVSGLGMFFLLNILIRRYCNVFDKRALYLGAFAGSLLYMFNHFTMLLVSAWPPIGPFHLSYMLLPWILALFIYNLQVKTSLLSIFLFSIMFLFLLSGNSASTLNIIFLLIAYLIFFRREIRKSSAKFGRFLVISFILVLFLSSYIYLPIIGVQSVPYLGSTEDLLSSLCFNSYLTSFLNLFRLGGANIWPNYPYYLSYMNNIFLIPLGYLIPILAVVSLFFRKGIKIKVFFGVVFILTLFFTKGINPPFEKLFLFLYTRIPYFGIYRAVYHKFVYFIALSYSVLIGFFVFQFFVLLKNQYPKVKNAIAIVPFIICFYGWPFFTNSVVRQNYLTVIPEEYGQAADTIEKDPSDFRILSVPPSYNGRSVLLGWDGDNKFIGNHPDRFLLDNAVLDSYWFINNVNGLNGRDSWASLKFESNFDSALNCAGILDIRYIFLHRDFVDKYYSGPVGDYVIVRGELREKTLESILKEQKGVEEIKDSQYFALYKLSDKYFLPHFYVPQNIIYSEGDVGTLADVVGFEDYEIRSAIFLTDNTDVNVDNTDEARRTLMGRADEVFVAGEREEAVGEILNPECTRMV